MIKNIFSVFRLKLEERKPAIVALLMAILLNALTVYKYGSLFSTMGDNYYKAIIKYFHISGFDPLTYIVVSEWFPHYTVLRHPLLAFFMYIPSLINKGLIALTGYNFSVYVVAILLVVSAFYSFIFLYRIFREVLRLDRRDTLLLSSFYFSFAYVMVAVITPDHFLYSMMLLLLTLYVSGKCMQSGRKLTILQTVLLFFFTAGVSLNNGLKTFTAALFINRRSFFRTKYLFIAVIVPCILIWCFAHFEYRMWVWPKEQERKEMKKQKQAKQHAMLMARFKDTTSLKDTAKIMAAVNKTIKQSDAEKAKRDNKRAVVKHMGKPLSKVGYLSWTDISTNRWESVVENLWGESIQLHQDYLLGDTLINRPVIVKYRWFISYALEVVLLLLFILGIICGRKSRFLWLTLSFFFFDLLLHIGLGFGINEVYIMAPHWLYVLPIAMGYLFTVRNLYVKQASRFIILLLTLYLWGYNGALLLQYML